MLDSAVEWTGVNARVAADMSDSPSVNPKYRPLRWAPIGPIGFACALFILTLSWPPVLDQVPPGISIAISMGLMVSIMGVVSGIHMHGPLGKPSREDDEREAALRKDSFLFCLGLLAGLNCLGQPILFVLSHWQSWHTGHGASVTLSALILNAALFGSVPTLYASWNLRE